MIIAAAIFLTPFLFLFFWSPERKQQEQLDAEAELQRDQELHGESRLMILAAFAGVFLLAFWASVRGWFSGVRFWLFNQRVCSWCKPARRIGGNPFAEDVTHSICPDCLAEQHRKLSSLTLNQKTI